MDIYFDRIKPLFDNSGKTDADLEREIGIPAKKISQWNIGYTKSYNKYIPQISTYFHVSTDYLLGNTDDPAPPGEKEKPAPKTVSGLCEKDQRLLKWFRSLPPEKQKAILVAQDGPEDAAD